MNKPKKGILFIFLFVLLSICFVVALPSNTSYAQIIPQSCAEGSCTICEFFELIQNVVNFLIGLATSLALLAVIIGGFRYMTAGSNPELLGKAKDVFKYAGMGFALVIGGWLIINVLLTVLGRDDNQGSWYNFTCRTIEIGTAGTEGFAGRGLGGGGAVGALKGEQFRSVTKWLPQINQVATQYSIDPCVLVTLVRKESKGNENTIGNDAYFHLKTPDAKAYNQFDISKPPLYGLKWDCKFCSWGFGLMQLTIFPKDSKHNTGSALGGWEQDGKPTYYGLTEKKWYTPAQLIDPTTSLRLGALHFRAKQQEGNDLRDAFGRYNGGADWKTKTSAVKYADTSMQLYNACALERRGSQGSIAAPGSFKGQSCSKYIASAIPDPTCGLVTNQRGTNSIDGSYQTIYMRPEVKDDFLKMAAEFQRTQGKQFYVTGKFWRDITTQSCVRDNKPGLAGEPRTADKTMRGHQSAMSVDISLDKPGTECPKNEPFSKGMNFTQWKWMVQNQSTYGFSNLGVRLKRWKSSTLTGDALLKAQFCGSEAWHWDYMKGSEQKVCPSTQDQAALQTK